MHADQALGLLMPAKAWGSLALRAGTRIAPTLPDCHPSSQACSDSETRLYALALAPDLSPGNKLDPSESAIRVQRVPLPEEVRPIP